MIKLQTLKNSKNLLVFLLLFLLLFTLYSLSLALVSSVYLMYPNIAFNQSRVNLFQKKMSNWPLPWVLAHLIKPWPAPN